MTARAMTRSLLVVIGTVMVLAIGLAVAGKQGWLAPLGFETTGQDSQVVTAIERTQEVSLLSLSVQGIAEKSRTAEVFSRWTVPGTGKKVFLQYNFTAKLGLDGSKVEVTRTGEKAYRVKVPDFTFIGYDEPTFKVAAEDGGVLSWVTPDIDQVQMVNEILDDGAQASYLASNDELLKDQAKTFYDSVIHAVDPGIALEYEFAS